MARRVARAIQTARTSAAGGQTQPAAVRVPLPGVTASRATPVTAMTAAGTAAQRCGWLVHRVVSIASSAQPEARPTRPAPVMTGSVAPANTTRTRRRVLTRPLSMEPATTTANGTRRPAAGAGSAATALVRWSAGVGVVVVMSVSLPER